MSSESTGYGPTDIEVLTGREAVRKRPGMYIGSTGERGLCHMVFEIAERAVNEVLAGRASRVDITLTPDGGVRVADDGPGDPELGDRLTTLGAVPGPRGRVDVPLGYVGVGPFVVNVLSSRLTAEVHGERVQAYERGIAVTPPAATGPAAGQGTAITFHPDPEVFDGTALPFDTLAERFDELTYLNRALDMTLTDLRTEGEPRSLRFHHPDGVRELVATLDGEDTDILACEREDPRMGGMMELALRRRDSGEPRIRGFANSRATYDGSHEAGFRAGVAAALTAYARAHRLLPETAPDIDPERATEGLTAVVSVKLDAPEFQGSTRDVLGNAAARACVEEAVRECLAGWLEERPEWASGWVRRVG
ncbi:DNA gyrase subunit B [Kitasatospora sp. NPDC101183]|uniref:DNA gyrase subunit B n=1 Tax=Kitasatospora sp. NPDC101183 TaxID=3364100 RepID=UPI00381C6168